MMGEWLTIGQLIDRLKVGEVAESDYQSMVYTVKRDEYGIKFCKPSGEIVEGDRKCLVAREFFIKRKWRILKNYVSFEKAMKALKDGYTVTFHDKDEFTITFNEADLLKTTIYSLLPLRTWSALTLGKWTIEND